MARHTGTSHPNRDLAARKTRFVGEVGEHTPSDPFPGSKAHSRPLPVVQSPIASSFSTPSFSTIHHPINRTGPRFQPISCLAL